MGSSCKEIERILVDYADGDLSASESSQVAEHIAHCESCRGTLDALAKSLKLADVIWEDRLEQLKDVRVSISEKTRQIRWPRYAAIAACILLVVISAIVWRALSRPAEKEPTFAEMEQKIAEAGNAPRLLAAVELLLEFPEAENIVSQQYRYIIETYPQTPAAAKAKLRIQ
jgi:anti-sigma factor RsiW